MREVRLEFKTVTRIELKQCFNAESVQKNCFMAITQFLLENYNSNAVTTYIKVSSYSFALHVHILMLDWFRQNAYRGYPFPSAEFPTSDESTRFPSQDCLVFLSPAYRGRLNPFKFLRDSSLKLFRSYDLSTPRRISSANWISHPRNWRRTYVCTYVCTTIIRQKFFVTEKPDGLLSRQQRDNGLVVLKHHRRRHRHHAPSTNRRPAPVSTDASIDEKFRFVSGFRFFIFQYSALSRLS